MVGNNLDMFYQKIYLPWGKKKVSGKKAKKRLQNANIFIVNFTVFTL